MPAAPAGKQCKTGTDLVESDKLPEAHEVLAKPAVPLGGETMLDSEMAMLASVNAPTWANFQKMMVTILGHEVFKGVNTEPAPSISSQGDQSGSQDPFDSKKFVMAMSRTSEYKCANNFFMRNMLYTGTPQQQCV